MPKCIVTIVGWWLVIVMLAVTAGLSACPSDSAYRRVAVTKEGIRFLFEYPSSYSEVDYSFQSETDYVALERYLPDGEYQIADREIKIFLTGVGKPDIKSYLDDLLKDLQLVVGDLQLVERSPIEVAGAKGELAVYTGFVDDTTGFSSKHLRWWKALVDHKGQIVAIMLRSDADKAEGAEGEFEHLIRNFRFLD